VEWGSADNPRVVVCVHGLTRVGRDFDRLAQVLAPNFRVVCPDVVGRGRSDWLLDPRFYAVPQYAADMATLIARLNVPTVSWVGTSMGGLIGITLAGHPGTPIGRMVINDIGPTLDAAALTRIGDYVGQPQRFDNLEEATDYIAAISAPFALRSREEWRSITRTVIKPDGDGWVLHYDPRIGLAFKGITPQAAAAAQQGLWQLYDAIRAPVLLLRGAQSDLLSPATALEMTRRGPQARLVEFAGVGHAPMLMHDDQIAVVEEFLLGSN
jgi:pimeloyl-ACP methyl ester carboxylesterase